MNEISGTKIAKPILKRTKVMALDVIIGHAASSSPD